MSTPIIDAHAHCGRYDRMPPQDLRDYVSALGRSGIGAAVMFSPVGEIYDRYDPSFRDNSLWRRRRSESNRYLSEMKRPDFIVYPFFFIWNDFAVEQITPGHKGIKWHRHPDEPRYEYENPRCAAAIEHIHMRNMPVCLEEEFENTMYFINQLARGVRVIIPHMGLLSGGYEIFRRRDVWSMPNIYADTALASSSDIKDYISRYGHQRIMFGSDFPFGDPVSELNKILRLNLTDAQQLAILGQNVARLLSESNI